MTYLRDRLTVARDLLAESGSIFVQIGDENVHRVRVLMDEVFGDDNAGSMISYKTTSGLASDFLAGVTDHILWYFKSKHSAKFRRLFSLKEPGEEGATQFNFLRRSEDPGIESYDKDRDVDRLKQGWHLVAHADLTSTGFAQTTNYDFAFRSQIFQLQATSTRWKTPPQGMERLVRANRVLALGKTPRYVRLLDDFPFIRLSIFGRTLGFPAFPTRRSMWFKQIPGLSSAASLWLQTPAIWFSTRPVVRARPPTSPSSGDVGGSQ